MICFQDYKGMGLWNFSPLVDRAEKRRILLSVLVVGKDALRALLSKLPHPQMLK